MQKLKEREQNTQKHLRSSHPNVTSTVSVECAANMPKFTSVVRAIQQERDFGVEPETVEAIAVPMELQATLRDMNFVVHEPGPGIPTDFFCSPLRQSWTFSLERYTAWDAEGAFKNCPPLFYQIYTEHAVINECSSQCLNFCCDEKLNNKINKHLLFYVNLTLCYSQQKLLLTSKKQ